MNHKPVKRWIYFPFLILLAAFVLDKLFFVGDLPQYFLRTASFINYDHKITLTVRLRNYLTRPDRKKTLVLFGNSRTLSFNNEYLSRKYPDWILYNYSVPGGTSDYYAYYMQIFKERDIRPDAILFALSPQGFNLNPAIAMDETMLNGLPLDFVLAHAEHFRLSDLTNYAAKKTFWTYRFRPNLETIRYRARNGSEFMYGLKEFQALVYQSVLENRGSTPYNDHADPDDDPDFWEKTARQTFANFFEPYQIHPGMIHFTRESLRLASELNARPHILWARVAPELRRMKQEKKVHIVGQKEKETINAVWLPHIQAMAAEYNVPIIDLNYQIQMNCDKFYDASHLAGACFEEFSDRIFEAIEPPR